MPYLVKMEAKIAKTFNEQVQFMIDDEKERDNFYTSLNCYQENHNIQKFVTDLLHIICEPKRLPLYEDIRFLVPPRDQIAYDRLIPRYDLDKMRMVRLARHCDEGLGFSVRGGFEHEVGIYVSEVDSGSQAHKQGLKVGDEIVLLNGFTIGQAIHQEVLNLIKARKELVLKVRHVGMTPVKNLPSDKLTWKYVDIGGSTSTLISDGKITSKLQDGEEVNLYINIPIHGALGCSVCSGPRQHPGIYIQSIKPTSLAEEAGLEVGDQVIRVNDVIFNKITHSQAVVAFKSSKHLDMVIRKGTGIELFKPRNDPILSCMENKENQQHLLKDVTDHNNKGNMSEEKIDAVDWSRTSHKQEDLIEAAIQVIDTNNAARPSSSSSKLAEAVKVMGQSSTDKANGQRVKADIHSRPSKDKQPISTNTEKRPRLYRKNHEPIYSSIEEVTSQPAQRISTGFDEPPSKHHPFPEASTDFRGSPSYETTIISTDHTTTELGIMRPITPDPNTLWSNTPAPSTVELSTFRPSTTGSSTVGPSTVRPSTVGHIIVGPSTEELGIVGMSTAGPSIAQPNTDGPSMIETSPVGPSNVFRASTSRADELSPNTINSIDAEPSYVNTDSLVSSILTKRLNPRIYRPIEIQSFQNQTAIRPSKVSPRINMLSVSAHNQAQSVEISHCSGENELNKNESPTTYMTEERKPNFRIQKPVLLHPTRNKNGEHKCSLSPPTAEELIISDGLYFKEGAFNLSRLFTNEQIAGRQMKLVNIKKEKCSDLGIVIEASLDRVIVGEMYAGGAIQKQGGVHTGDQIMMVDRHSLIGVTIERAYKLLKEEFNSSKPIIQLVVAKAPPSDFGDEVVPRPDYLDIPISNLDDFMDDDDVEICMYNNDIPVTII